MTTLDSVLKKQRHHFVDKGLYSQGYGLSSSRVQMWELDYKQGWVPKKWCFQTAAQCWRWLLRVRWKARKSNQSILKEINPEYSLEGLMLKLKLRYFANSWLTGKDPDAGKDWRQKEKRATEDEMVGWHHWFNGHELGQTLRDGEGQGSLTGWSPWCPEESDTIWLLNKNSWWIWLCLSVPCLFVCLSVCLFCWGMWDLSSQTRDQAHVSCSGPSES